MSDENQIKQGAFGNSANAAAANAYNPQFTSYAQTTKTFEPITLLQELKYRRETAAIRIEHHAHLLDSAKANFEELDKAIASLTPTQPEKEDALLVPDLEPSSVEIRKQAEQDAADEDVETECIKEFIELGKWTRAKDFVFPEPSDAPPVIEYLVAHPGAYNSDDYVIGEARYEAGVYLFGNKKPYAYRIIEPSADEGWGGVTASAEADAPRAIIEDDIPTIPRAEIPPGSALESFTDSGVETVRTPSGLTHVVTDEPVVAHHTSFVDGELVTREITASEFYKPAEESDEGRWPYNVSYTMAEGGFGDGNYEYLYKARNDFEAFKLDPKYLTVTLQHHRNVIDTFARPTETVRTPEGEVEVKVGDALSELDSQSEPLATTEQPIHHEAAPFWSRVLVREGA